MARPRILTAGILVSLAGLLSAQVVPPEPGGNSGGTAGGTNELPPQPTWSQMATSSLLVRLKSPRVELADALALTTELCVRRTSDRLKASTIVRDHYIRHEKSYDKQCSKVFAQFEQAAKKAQRDLVGKQGAAEVDTLRTESLQVSRRGDLTKAQIKHDVDPRIAKLRKLLLPNLANVLSCDAKLDPDLQQLRNEHTQLRDWHALYAQIGQDLELHEDAAKHFKKYPPPLHPGSADRIDEQMSFAMFAGLAMSPQDRKVLEANATIAKRTPHEEYLGTLRLNEIRYVLGLNLLLIDEKLSAAARDHSTDMHTLGFFSHTSPVDGKQRFGQRASNFGTSAHAENIAAGQRTGQGAITGWWYSPGHHRNMLGGHRRTGLGQHETMWTQMFGG